MKLIDSHTHIYAKAFDEDRADVVRSAKRAGVEAILLPNEDTGSIDPINKLCDAFPSYVFPMMGLHPSCIDSNYTKELRTIEAALSKHTYYAVGEIGIDLYWGVRYLKEQKEAFEEQLRWSADLQLPVTIHARDAFNEVLDCLYKVGPERLRGVFHCFGGTVDEWNEIALLSSFYAGIGGIITFKNNRLQETVQHIPLDHILLETDAPYLAPTPYRGKRNEPGYLINIAKQAAACYHTTPETMARSTYQNTLDLFNIPTNHIDLESF
jgi:TatD DNase family protein